MVEPEIKNFNGNKVVKQGTSYKQSSTPTEPKSGITNILNTMATSELNAARQLPGNVASAASSLKESVTAPSWGINKQLPIATEKPAVNQVVSQPSLSEKVATPEPVPAKPVGGMVKPDAINLTQSGYFDRQDQANLGTSGTGKTRYTLNEKGQPLRMDAATGQVTQLQDRTTHNILKPGEQPFVMTRENTGAQDGSAGVGFNQINKAIDQGTMSAADGLGMYKRYNDNPAQRAAAQKEALLQMAFTQPNGQTNVGDVGGIKRNAATAAALLSRQMDSESEMTRAGMNRDSALARMVQEQANADRSFALDQTKVKAIEKNKASELNMEKNKQKQAMLAAKDADPFYQQMLKQYGGENPDEETLMKAHSAYNDYVDSVLNAQ